MVCSCWAMAAAAAAAADEEVEEDVGIPLPMGPAPLLDTAGAVGAEEVGAVCSSGEGVMLARAGGCPIGVIDRPEPEPIGAGGVGAGGSAADTGGANALLLGA